MQGSREVIQLAEVPVWLEKMVAAGEFFLELALLVAVLIVLVLGFSMLVMWLAGYTERLRERYFPLHSCDLHALEAISEVFERLSRESRRYDFIALRVRSGTWQGKEWTFVWGAFGAVTSGEGGPEWGTCQCVFVLAPRSEEERLRKQGGPFPFIFCGTDQCILRLKASKLKDVMFKIP